MTHLDLDRNKMIRKHFLFSKIDIVYSILFLKFNKFIIFLIIMSNNLNHILINFQIE